MSFSEIEISNDDGRPISLYAWSLGAATWRYTSSDADVVLAGYRWKAVPISDDGVKLTGEANTETLTITAPNTIAPVQMYIGTPPSQPMILSIFHYHEGDTDAILNYQGEVQQVGQPTPGTAIIYINTLSASMQRDGLRLGFQRTCPFALYDPRTCKADPEAHAVELRVFEVVDNTVTLQGMEDIDDGFFNGGFLQWSHPTRGLEYRGIELQVGAQCTMFGLADGLYYGLTVKAYPGCDRLTKTCADKFNNLPNYGGVPDMPGTSPFDGNPVF